MKDEKIHIKRIINAIEKINRYLENKTLQDLENNNLLYDAVLMEFMLIGEEAVRVSDTIKEEHSTIEWHKMIGMCNRITHQYFHVDPKII